MFIGPNWCAIHVIARGDDFRGDTLVTTPRYEALMADWWPNGPHYDRGDDIDTFFPITTAGIWMPHVDTISNLDELEVIKYSGDRYKIPIDSTDCSIEISLTTENPSDLIVYLIDPYGNMNLCWMDSTYNYNIFEKDFMKGWEGIINARLGIRTKNWKCKNCKDAVFCRCCPAKARLEMGNDEAIVPYFCKIAKLRKKAVEELNGRT